MMLDARAHLADMPMGAVPAQLEWCTGTCTVHCQHPASTLGDAAIHSSPSWGPGETRTGKWEENTSFFK